MKKLLKILLLLLVFSYVHAEDVDLPPKSASQVSIAKEAIENYCNKGKKAKGCVYNQNNSLYTQAEIKTYSSSFEISEGNLPGKFVVPKGVELTRGYTAFDGTGNAVFAGCYRYEYTQAQFDEDSRHTPSKIPATSPGTYFIFEIVYGNKNGTANSCKVRKTSLIPAKGLKKCFYSMTSPNSPSCPSDDGFIYDGKSSIDGVPFATFNNWTATNGGSCPTVFGYTANARFITLSENKYAFAQNLSDFSLNSYAFLLKEKYVNNPGCTDTDVDGNAETQKLLNEALNGIKKATCPSTLEGMSSFSNNLEDTYSTIRNDNPLRVLYSKKLIDEVTWNNVRTQINKALVDKVDSCSSKICGLTSSEIQKVNSNRGSDCKNSCVISNVIKPSSSPNAKCYCCGGTRDCTYQWTESPKSNCSLQSNVSQGQCVGTNSDIKCRNCMIAAYEKSGLSQEKISCLISQEIQKEMIAKELQDNNNNVANNDINNEIDENRAARKEVYDYIVSLPTFEIYNGTRTCKQILGPGLTAVVHAGIRTVQIIGAIIAIVKGMMVLIPAIIAKDADGLKKASKTLVSMAIILVIIFLVPGLLRFLGKIAGFDISCLV